MTPLTKLLVESREGIVKEAVNRFLGWKLPEDFSPDCGISFSSLITTEPVGTNLLTATQAEAMVRFILDDLLVRKAVVTGLEIAKECVPAKKEAFSQVSPDEWGHPMGWNKCGDAMIEALDSAIGEVTE